MGGLSAKAGRVRSVLEINAGCLLTDSSPPPHG